MSIGPLSAIAFASLIDRVGPGEPPLDAARLHPDDRDLVAFAAGLAALRGRPEAPEPPPWRTVKEVDVRATALGVNGTLPSTPLSGALSPRASARRPHRPVERRLPRRRVSLGDLAFLTALVAVTIGVSWHAFGSIEPRRRMPSTPQTPAQPAVLPGASPASTQPPGAARATMPAGPLKPTSDPTMPQPGATGSSAGAWPSATAASAGSRDDGLLYPPRPDDRRGARSAPATDSPYPDPQPGPSGTDAAYPAPPSVSTAEPRITRIAPPAVPTTAPTDLPTAPASPSPRTPPPTPTAPGLPTSPPEQPTAAPTPTTPSR